MVDLKYVTRIMLILGSRELFPLLWQHSELLTTTALPSVVHENVLGKKKLQPYLAT